MRLWTLNPRNNIMSMGQGLAQKGGAAIRWFIAFHGEESIARQNEEGYAEAHIWAIILGYQNFRLRGS